MSQSAEGPGWWLASDGKWYPPNLHPSASPPPPPPTENLYQAVVGRGTGAPTQDSPGGSTLTTEAPQPNSWSYQPPSYPSPGYMPPAAYGAASSWAGNPNVVVDPVLQLPLAPWWKRVVALIIDGLVLGLGSFMLLFVIGIIADIARGHPAVANTTTTSNSPDVLIAFLVIWIFACLPLAIYYGVMNGSRRGQTVVKMALSIAVRDAQTGAKLGFWRAVGRFAITVLFMILFYVPYIIDSLSPLWDKRRQSWHDKVAHSVVVDLKP
jgi:uncharacterized RDD family membrane protein YckC